ncbi:MAG: hypothetical protein WC107_03090 [Patescibacteria group bacterium]
MNKDNAKLGPEVQEPNDKEIGKSIQKVKNRFGFLMEREDAIEFTKLRNELAWWIKVERGLKNPESVTEEMAKEVQVYEKEHYNNGITLEEAFEKTRSSVSELIPVAKKRIANQTNSIIQKYLK